MSYHLTKHLLKLFFFLTISTILINCSGIKEYGFKDKGVETLVRKGVELYEKGKYDKSLKNLQKAAERAYLPEDKSAIAVILSQGGLRLTKKKLFEEALLYYESALRINQTLNNKPEIAKNHSYIGKTFAELGQYEKSIESFKKAIEIQRELNDKQGVAHNLNNIAVLYSYLGNPRKALNILANAVKIAEETNNPIQLAHTLINMGTMNLTLRDYRKSIENLKHALHIVEDLDKPELQSIAFETLGVVYRQEGNYDEALSNYKKALHLNKKLKQQERIALDLSIIGELYKELGAYTEATKYLKQALTVSQRAKNKLITAIALNYLGEVKYKQGDFKEAVDLYNSSLEIFKELGFKDGIGRVLCNLGYLKGEMKELDKAIENLNSAIEIYREIGDREWIRIALFGKGIYLEEQGKLLLAEKSYKEAIDIFESIREDLAGGKEVQKVFNEVNAKMYENLISLLLRLGKEEEALEYIERSRSKKIRDIFLKSGLTSFDSKTRGLLNLFDVIFSKKNSLDYQLAKERSKPFPNEKKIKNLVETLAKTKKDFLEVSLQLKEINPTLFSLLMVEPKTLFSLERKEIPFGTVFIEYFIAEENTFIFIVNNNNLTIKSVPIKRKQLEEMVTLFIKLIHENKNIPTKGWKNQEDSTYAERIKAFKKLSSTLYGYLIEPLEDEIKNSDTLAIIPFGVLYQLPFHALARERGDGTLEFLIERKNIVYLVSYSESYLNLVLKERISGQGKHIKSAIAFGNPDLGEPELLLPYSEKEVLTIKRLFPNAKVFIKKDATKNNFKNNWGQYELVHIAAHGLIQEEPSILLAPLGSGALTISDIMGLPPTEKTHLVVLSACKAATILHTDSSKEVELNSIALAFNMTGVNSVIATLWEVEDKATAEFMETFYRSLKAEGKFNYKALKQAQLNMLGRTDKYGQPFYWAPFILIGTWQ